MELLGVDRIGPGLGADLGDRLRIEPAKVGGALRIAPAPGHDGLSPPLFQRRVVEEGVGFGRQRLERKGDGSVRSQATMRISPASRRARIRSSPSMSIASCRQSAIA